MNSTTASSKNEETDKNEKLELSRNDLLKLLSCLEAKLQASEIAIAALKVDRLKRLFYPASIKRNSNLKKKLNRDSLNYATIIPTNKICSKPDRDDFESVNLENTNLETVLDSNLETKLKTIETNLDELDDDFIKDLDDENDIKNDSLFPNDKYNEYRKNLESNPYLALASDLKFAYDNESNESLITKVYNSRVLRVKKLIQQQHDARKFLEEQLDELSTRYKNVVDELEIEKDKNIKFERDETVKKLEKTEQEKKDLQEELSNLKKEFETEKEREKIMIVYLLSERKQLIIKLIEENEKNTELVNLLSREKSRSAEMEEGLEDESKRSLLMEIDLECLTNKYENEKSILDDRIKSLSKKNADLESECDRLKQKLGEYSNSNNNNLITANKNLPDLGEGVRSTIVTFNNAIANLAGLTVVNSQQVKQVPNVVQSLQSSKPSLAAKPSFDSLSNQSTNGNKPTVTIINTTSSFNQPIRSNSVSSRHPSDQTANTKTISSLNKLNSSVSTANDVNSSISTSTTSVASVIQKFSNNTISNTQPHPPIQRKQSSSGLVANIAQSISQNSVGQDNEMNRKRPPPPVPQKPNQTNTQLLKERKLEQTATTSNEFKFLDKHLESEVDLIKQINSNLDRLSKIPLEEACSKSAQAFEKLDKDSTDLDAKIADSLDSSECVEALESRPSRSENKKKFVRTNAFKSQGSK